MANHSISFEKLNNENYMTWSVKMKMYLIKEDVWNVVRPVEAGANIVAGGGVAADAAANAELARREDQALALITLMVENDQLYLLRSAENGRDAWNALRDHHQRNTVSNRSRVMKKLFKTDISPGGSMQEHLQIMCDMIAKFHEMGHPLQEEVAVNAILASVGEEYEGLVTAIEAWEEDRLTLDIVKSKLLDEWKRKKDRKDVDAAYVVRKNVYTSFVVTMGKRQQPEFTCYYCQKPGHLKRDCILYKKI